MDRPPGSTEGPVVRWMALSRGFLQAVPVGKGTTNGSELHSATQRPILIVDTEGSGLYPDDGARVSVLSWARRLDDGTIDSGAKPFGQGPSDQLFDVQEDAGASVFEELLQWFDQHFLVFHNASHDLQQLNAGGILGYPGRDLSQAFGWDTSLVQRHLDPLERVGLEDSCVRRLGLAPWKLLLEGWSNRFGGSYAPIPWSVIEPYATEDAVNTLLLYEDQIARLAAGEGNLEIVERNHRITRVLFGMEVRGVGYDAPASRAAGHVLVKRAREIEAMLPGELRPPTPERMCTYFYDQQSYDMTRRDNDGKLVRSADDVSRQGLREQGAPFIDELDEYQKVETACTSWYFPWADLTAPDGRLRMRVRQTKVTSGRFSGERVNLMAIPHDMQLPDIVPSVRSFMHPREGCRLWEVDLGQAEVRVGAIATGSKSLIAEYRRGRGADVYAKVALDVFGVERPDHDKECECADCKHFDHYRSLCKRIVLSTIYSGGAKTLVATAKKFMRIDMTTGEANGFLRPFHGRYPELRIATTRWEAYALQNHYVPLALGEQRWFQPYEMMCAKCKGTGGNEYKGACRLCKGTGKQCYKALNQRIQGSVAAVMKPCMIEVDERFPGALLLQIHDSLLLETPDPDVPHEVGKIMCSNFENVFKLPFVADVKEWATAA